MGMTIDEAIKAIHKMLAYTDLSVRENLNADMIDACHMAINTMRKYQKIEDIYYHQSGEALENSLRAVIEDGKID